MVVNGHPFAVLTEPDPSSLPWRRQGVDLVIEATGRFTRADDAAAHLQARARRVLITAPAGGPDIAVNMRLKHEGGSRAWQAN